MNDACATPAVSVIVPAHNDRVRLEQCLLALAAQTYPRDRMQVIVVDNASSEDLRPALPQDDDRFIFVVEPKKGSYAARNKGLEVATGRVLAFTDSDCLPQADWVDKGVRALTGEPAADMVAGAIELFFASGAPRTGADLFENKHAFPQERYLVEQHFAATANMLTLRTTMDAVGPFDDRLQSGGDAEWGQRVASLGLRQHYAADAVVRHPARDSRAAVLTKTRRQAEGHRDAALHSGRGRGHLFKAALREAMRGLRVVVGVLLAGRPPQGLLPKLRYLGCFLSVRRTYAGVYLRAALGTPSSSKRATHECSAAPEPSSRAEVEPIRLTVTCVIPTHRRDDMLAESLASALSQGDALVEVVVVDDAGSPATRRLVETTPSAGKVLRYVHNQRGRGAASSRNVGAELASEELLAFLDDDDIWRDGYIDAAVTALSRTGADAVFTQLDWFDMAGRPLPRGLTVPDVVARNPGVSGSNVVIRRSAFSQIGGFDDRLWVSNDLDLLVRLLEAGCRYDVVERPLVHWRQHESDRLSRPSQRRLDGLRLYYDKHRTRATTRQRLRLRGIIHDNLRRMATTPAGRVRHGLVAVVLIGPGEYARRLLRRRSPSRSGPRPGRA